MYLENERGSYKIPRLKVFFLYEKTNYSVNLLSYQGHVFNGNDENGCLHSASVFSTGVIVTCLNGGRSMNRRIVDSIKSSHPLCLSLDAVIKAELLIKKEYSVESVEH